MMAYDPDFIRDEHIPLPRLSQRMRNQALDDGQFINHSRYSLVFHKSRGFAIVAAHNVDGTALLEKQETSRSFRYDPKIKPNALQVGNDRGYWKNPWDRGHLVRRKSMSWGDPDEAKIAERESDYYSNICPQHEQLHDQAWGQIEDWMIERAEEDQRACVFTGPVFTDDDPEIVNKPGQLPIRVPAGFWKIISVRRSGFLRCAAFLVWQRDYDRAEPLPFTPVLEQVRITTIEVLTGLSFSGLRRFDPLLFDAMARSQTERRDAEVAIAIPMEAKVTASGPGPDGGSRGGIIVGKNDILL